MWDVTSWSKDLAVEIGGRDVINHAGAAALRLLADRTGLTSGLSRALARRGFVPFHDRGRVLADTAVLIADGGRVLSDLATLRDQGELYGPVASDPTLWRTLHEIGQLQHRKIARQRAKTREHVWSLIAKRHGQIPPSRVADRDLGTTIVIRMDASLVIAHSDKELAAGTYKGSWGHHPLMAWCDNTGESLALLLRKGSAGSNTTSDHIAVLDEAITGIPVRYRRNLLITVDGAGASHGLVDHITKLNASPWRRVHYSIGWELVAGNAPPSAAYPTTPGTMSSISRANPATWPKPGSSSSLPCCASTPTATSWRTGPKTCGSYAAARNPTPAHNFRCSKRPTGGATNSWPPTRPARQHSSSRPATDHTPGSRTAFAAASKPASDTYRRPQSTSTGAGAWPQPSPATCCAGYGCSASTGRWPRPNRKPCAIGCCTPPPASCAANANARSVYPQHGPGQANSPPASTRRSLYPHRQHVDQRNPAPHQRNNRACGTRHSPDATVGPTSLNRTLTTRSTNITEINIREPKAVPVTPANDQG